VSRYTEPRLKRVRALGTSLPGLTAKNAEQRPYPPGQHGQSRRGKASEYALRLREKQKLLFNYGLTEKQLRRIVEEARHSKGNTGSLILSLLERRLDNAVFRAGFARTIPAARQLVAHGHILVDGQRVDIPSFRVKVGNKLTLHKGTVENSHVRQSLEQPQLGRPGWLEYDDGKLTATVASLPDEDSVPVEVHPGLVVEYYAQRL
jgi:small subunit ribosomal protein S4